LHFQNGSLLLFRFLRVDVYLHWLWFLLAFYQVMIRDAGYDSRLWNFAELMTLFGIVLVHEFGHALACKQVGGQADRIILWPLGGLALARPPKRPGALLWTVAAGPLVNVVLLPVTFGLYVLAVAAGAKTAQPNLCLFLEMFARINLGLLIFNLLPIYPLDGGQILQALLWFAVGRARSVFIASIIGLAGAAALLYWGFQENSEGVNLTVLVAMFIGMQAWSGIGRARAIAAVDRMPRSPHATCPSCGAAPLLGEFWPCDYCRRPFDIFETRGVCPNCATRHPEVQCMDCAQVNLLSDWLPAIVLPVSEEEQRRARTAIDHTPTGSTPQDAC
jgi:Zn-dependent protease